jgi:hypothetical protein
MIVIKTRINVAKNGILSGHAKGLPPGAHDAEIRLVDGGHRPALHDRRNLLARVRAIQAELAVLPALDNRGPDEIVGYNERGHFD